MKKRCLTAATVVLLSGSMLFTSCVGSFRLTGRLLAWNKSVDNKKIVQELVFVAFCIVPVYEISLIADLFILNSIEFWSGDNPLKPAESTRTIETEDGSYTIETRSDGYHIQKEGEEHGIDLTFNEAEQTWNIELGDDLVPFLQFKDNQEVAMFFPDGSEMTVPLSQSGVLAFKQVAEQYAYYAAR